MQPAAQIVKVSLQSRDVNGKLPRQSEEREIVDGDRGLNLAARFAEVRGAHGSTRPAGMSLLRQRLGADCGKCGIGQFSFLVNSLSPFSKRAAPMTAAPDQPGRVSFAGNLRGRGR